MISLHLSSYIDSTYCNKVIPYDILSSKHYIVPSHLKNHDHPTMLYKLDETQMIQVDTKYC